VLEREASLQVATESWQENNAQLVSALNAQSVSTGIIRSVVMVVVVLGSVLGLLLAVALIWAIAPARRAAAMDLAQAIRL